MNTAGKHAAERLLPLIKVLCYTLSLLFCLPVTSHICRFAQATTKFNPLCHAILFVKMSIKTVSNTSTIIQLSSPKHFNCSYFLWHPAICIKPFTASPSTMSSSAISSFTTSPAPSFPKFTSFLTLTFQVLFSLFATLSQTDLLFDLCICFHLFFCLIAFYPLYLYCFFFSCWLRIRGQPNWEQHWEEISLQERLGSLSPVPGQWKKFLLCKVFFLY